MVEPIVVTAKPASKIVTLFLHGFIDGDLRPCRAPPVNVSVQFHQQVVDFVGDAHSGQVSVGIFVDEYPSYYSVVLVVVLGMAAVKVCSEQTGRSFGRGHRQDCICRISDNKQLHGDASFVKVVKDGTKRVGHQRADGLVKE
jgi:hypothetical protein